jgi:hypothetical protein
VQLDEVALCGGLDIGRRREREGEGWIGERSYWYQLLLSLLDSESKWQS